MSVYEKVFDKIKENNIDVYPPNVHKGKVNSNYIVLLDGGRARASTFTSQTVLLDVLVYVPEHRFTDLDLLSSKVKNIVDGLYPLVIPTGNETAAFYDESIEGWMKSVEYRYTVRNKHVR